MQKNLYVFLIQKKKIAIFGPQKLVFLLFLVVKFHFVLCREYLDVFVYQEKEGMCLYWRATAVVAREMMCCK